MIVDPPETESSVLVNLKVALGELPSSQPELLTESIPQSNCTEQSIAPQVSLTVKVYPRLRVEQVQRTRIGLEN